MLRVMTAQRCVLGWREWLAAEWTILRSTLRGLRRGRLATAAAQRVRAVVWAVSPQDGHRHAFSLSHLTDLGFHSVATARCSRPAPHAALRSKMLPTGPICLTCAISVGGLIAEAARRQNAPHTP